MATDASAEQDLAVLREMVRLAENKRKEEWEILERVNKYNLALIAFAGSFLSLLISTEIPNQIVRVSGFCLMISIFISLFAVKPTAVKGGTISVEEDVKNIRSKKVIPLQEYLLDTADITERAAKNLGLLANKKKRLTIISAIFLAASLIITYILYAYA